MSLSLSLSLSLLLAPPPPDQRRCSTATVERDPRTFASITTTAVNVSANRLPARECAVAIAAAEPSHDAPPDGEPADVVDALIARSNPSHIDSHDGNDSGSGPRGRGRASLRGGSTFRIHVNVYTAMRASNSTAAAGACALVVASSVLATRDPRACCVASRPAAPPIFRSHSLSLSLPPQRQSRTSVFS